MQNVRKILSYIYLKICLYIFKKRLNDRSKKIQFAVRIVVDTIERRTVATQYLRDAICVDR